VSGNKIVVHLTAAGKNALAKARHHRLLVRILSQSSAERA